MSDNRYMRGRWTKDEPLPVCEECGAVNHGNASCVNCHRNWTITWGHIPCLICDTRPPPGELAGDPAGEGVPAPLASTTRRFMTASEGTPLPTPEGLGAPTPNSGPDVEPVLSSFPAPEGPLPLGFEVTS